MNHGLDVDALLDALVAIHDDCSAYANLQQPTAAAGGNAALSQFVRKCNR